MTLKQLESLKSKWQKTLRIQDWDISLKVVSLAEMLDITGDDNLGACMPMEWKKKAKILVLDEADIGTNEDDQETILVHELMHVVMPPKDFNLNGDDSPHFKHYERVVDQMARTLVELSRQ